MTNFAPWLSVQVSLLVTIQSHTAFNVISLNTYFLYVLQGHVYTTVLHFQLWNMLYKTEYEIDYQLLWWRQRSQGWDVSKRPHHTLVGNPRAYPSCHFEKLSITSKGEKGHMCGDLISIPYFLKNGKQNKKLKYYCTLINAANRVVLRFCCLF